MNFEGGENLENVDASALDADFWVRGFCATTAETLTIEGAQGDNDIRGIRAENSIITTFDGNDRINVREGNTEINAGNGDNRIHLGGLDSDSVTVNTGDGDDIVHVADKLKAGWDIDGGGGYSTLAMRIELAADATADADGELANLFANFEAVKLCRINDDYIVDMDYLNEIQHVILGWQSWPHDHETTIQGLNDDAILEYHRRHTDNPSTVNVETDAQTFNVNLNGRGLDQDFGTLNLDNVETLNLDTCTRCKNPDVNPDDLTYTISMDMDSLETLNISGETQLELSEPLTTVETVNAGDFDQKLVISLKGNENDVTLTAGDGDNEITSGSGDNTITGGEGNNTFVFATTQDLNGTDTITDFAEGTNEIDFLFGEGDNIEQDELYGDGTGYQELGDGDSISADAGMLVWDTTLDDLDMSTVLDAANSADNPGDLEEDDMIYFAADDGVDTQIFKLVSDGSEFVEDQAGVNSEHLITLQGVTDASDTLSEANFADFS